MILVRAAVAKNIKIDMAKKHKMNYDFLAIDLS
jgi:hypothetical protein